jgi:transposase-like protein
MSLENQSATIQVPRDRNGTFEPQIIPKHEKRISLFNDQIISMYAYGMTERDINRKRSFRAILSRSTMWRYRRI